MIFIISLIFCSLTSFANMNVLQTKAIFKSRNGALATVLYQGKVFQIKAHQIQNLSKSKTGQKVTVTFYPSDLGILE